MNMNKIYTVCFSFKDLCNVQMPHADIKDAHTTMHQKKQDKRNHGFAVYLQNEINALEEMEMRKYRRA